jgi:hypothetical protein
LWLVGVAGEALGGPGPTALWAVDRDGCEAVALDRDLFVRVRAPVPWPTEVEPRTGGGAWVLSAVEADPLGSRELLALSVDGEVEARVVLGVAIDLAAVERADDALVVELGAPARVLRFGRGGEPGVVLEHPGALCAAGTGDAVLVGDRAGGLALYEGVALIALAEGTGAVEDVALAPDDGWWVLRGTDGVLERRGADLALLWQVRTGLAATHLAPVPGGERVWLAGADEARARRHGPGGALEVETGRAPLSGLGPGVGLQDGGVVLVAPGALLALDTGGAWLPGQGGFSYLADAARARE